MTYWRNPISTDEIIRYYYKYLDIAENTKYVSELIQDIDTHILYSFIQMEFEEKNPIIHGVCLQSHLINKACCLVNNKNLLGVVRGFDSENPRYLIVDFGDVSECKVDIDELIIAGINT